MHTKNEEHEYEFTEHSSNAKSVLTGLVIGGLVGAGTVLLFAPQPGEKTRAELRQGTMELRDRTTEKVKSTVDQVKSKANQIKADVQIKASELQTQGKDVIAKQLGRVSEAADARKKAIENS